MDLVKEGFIKQLPARCWQEFHPDMGPLLIPAVLSVSPWHFRVRAVCAPHVVFAFIAPLGGKDCEVSGGSSAVRVLCSQLWH